MTRAVTLANLADSNILTADGVNDRVGIGSTIPKTKLDVAGIVSATSYQGDGSNLTGITAGATLSAGSGSQRIVLTSLTSGTMTSAATDAELTYNSDTDTLVAGNISIGGTLTYEDVTNVDSIGVVTARSGIRVGSGQSIGSDGADVVYYGDGSQLSGIAAGGISTSASSPSANTVVTLDLSSAQHHELTLTAGITTVTCSGGSFGDSHSVVLIQPSSGIATVGFSTFFLFPSGSVPVMSEGSGKFDLVSFVVKRVGAGGTQLLASAGLDYQ